MYHQGIRNVRPPRISKKIYKGKSIENQLTLHHLIPLRKNGPTTKENGSVVCRYCHDYIEQLSEAEREVVNNELREYKINCLQVSTKSVEPLIPVELEPEDMPEELQQEFIPVEEFTEQEYQEFLQKKRKQEIEKSKWNNYR